LKTRFPQTILITITTALILLGSLNVAFAQSEWSLQVNGEVSNNLSLTADQLAALPITIVQADIYCYGAFVTGGSWIGPRLSQILQMAELGSQAESVEFTAEDGYMVTIPITTAMREDVIVAYKLNGQPLLEGLRLVIPEVNGNMWIAGITQITVTALPSNNPPNAYILPNFNANITIPVATPAPTPTPAPTFTPQPSNQTATPPAPTPTDSQPQQQSSSTQSPPSKYDYTLAFAAITVIMVTLATGYVLRKRKITTSSVFSPKS
jgi:DMSO/TMAO reductase YedYZ molybdopterin-dependent catalytic subunit